MAVMCELVSAWYNEAMNELIQQTHEQLSQSAFPADMMHGADDPTDVETTTRVLTIMLAEEY